MRAVRQGRSGDPEVLEELLAHLADGIRRLAEGRAAGKVVVVP